MLSNRARLISILIGLIILATTSYLVRKGKLYNIYAITWFFISVLFFIMGIFPTLVVFVSEAMGIYFAPAAIIMIAIGGMMAIILHLSMIVTQQQQHIRHFEKEIALLKKEN